jgi:hypothetical protein
MCTYLYIKTGLFLLFNYDKKKLMFPHMGYTQSQGDATCHGIDMCLHTLGREIFDAVLCVCVYV